MNQRDALAKKIEGLRTPPHAIEAEQAVLGGLMLDPTALLRISDWLSESDFWRRDHQLIYRAIIDLHAKDQPSDAVTLGEWFEAQDLAEMVGGARYVVELANTTPSAANITAYAEIVREKSRLRQAIDVGTQLAGRAFDPKGADVALIVAEAQSALANLQVHSQLGGLVPMSDRLRAWIETIQTRYDSRQRMTGVLTPWIDVNERTLGWQPGDLIIVAGRPSMGKTIFGTQCAFYPGLRKSRAAFFSLEMRTEAIIGRAVADIGRIQHEHIRCPTDMQDDEWPRWTSATQVVREASILIDDQPGLTSAQIVARMKREHMRKPLTFAVVDHLGEMARAGRDPVNEIANDCRALKRCGKELGIPVMLLCQLNRAVTGRHDRRPTLADLRGSGGIEEVADVIVFLHREDYYDRETDMPGVVEVNFAKGRDMPLGEPIYLENQFGYMRMENWPGHRPLRIQRDKAADAAGDQTFADRAKKREARAKAKGEV